MTIEQKEEAAAALYADPEPAVFVPRIDGTMNGVEVK